MKSQINNYKNWNINFAIKIASQENIQLTSKHIEIIIMIRKFYKKYNIIPQNRMLSKFLKNQIGNKKSNSQYLLSLFPKGITKQANKIAGLPQSNICL